MNQPSQLGGTVFAAMATRRRELLRLVDINQVTPENLKSLMDLLGNLIDEAEERDNQFFAIKERLKELAIALRGQERAAEMLLEDLEHPE